MLTNANHQMPDQRTGESSGPTEHPTPPHHFTADEEPLETYQAIAGASVLLMLVSMAATIGLTLLFHLALPMEPTIVEAPSNTKPPPSRVLRPEITQETNLKVRVITNVRDAKRLRETIARDIEHHGGWMVDDNKERTYLESVDK